MKLYVPWRREISEHFRFIIKISHLTFKYLHLLFSFSDNTKQELHPVTSENLKDHSIFSYTVDRNLIVFLSRDYDCKHTPTCMKHTNHNLQYKHFTYHSVLIVKHNTHEIYALELPENTVAMTDRSNNEKRKPEKHAT